MFPICFLGVSVAARGVGVPGIFGVRATQWVAPTRGAFRGFGGPDRSPPGGCPRWVCPVGAWWVSPIRFPRSVFSRSVFVRSQRSRQGGGCTRYLRGEGDPVGRPYAGRVSGIWGPRSFAAGWVSPVGVPGIFGVRATQWVAPTDGVEPCKLMKWRTAPSPFG